MIADSEAQLWRRYAADHSDVATRNHLVEVYALDRLGCGANPTL
jgi:hypothetical protein